MIDGEPYRAGASQLGRNDCVHWGAVEQARRRGQRQAVQGGVQRDLPRIGRRRVGRKRPQRDPGRPHRRHPQPRRAARLCPGPADGRVQHGAVPADAGQGHRWRGDPHGPIDGLPRYIQRPGNVGSQRTDRGVRHQRGRVGRAIERRQSPDRAGWQAGQLRQRPPRRLIQRQAQGEIRLGRHH